MSGEGPSVVLIGIDGATFAVLDPLMRSGDMPFLREWSARGVRAVLSSTAHPLTPIAWTTLMTGRNPGNHGVFDFVRADVHAAEPTYTLGTSADVRVETLWAMASRHGRRVTCLNFPSMFPPPPIDGFVVPGFVPWRYLPRAVHPRDLYPRLKRLPGFEPKELALDWDIERKALQGLPESEFEEWILFHIGREMQWFSIARLLMREERCALTAVLFDGTDKLQHLCYHLLDPTLASQHRSPWAERMRNLCLEYFRQLDRFIAALVETAGAGARVFIASDHGFHAAANRIFYANVWLEQQGYFAWKEGTALDREARLAPEGHAGPETFIDWSRTVAFALTASSNAIWIRRRNDGHGHGVSDPEYPAVLQRLIDGLKTVIDPDTGKKVIERVMTREEAFPGAAVNDAPDLTLVLHDRSFLSVLRSDSALKSRRLPYGTHHPDGVFMAAGPEIRRDSDLNPFPIVNITPTILHALELPLPADLDGRVTTDAFEPSWMMSHPVRYEESAAAPHPSPVSAPPSLGADADREIRLRLKALGYLE
jgi:predicted AlkP superfamily phosphohydrolase/phosphomutase